MEISDFVFKKKALEIDLIRTISHKLKEFQAETGYSPSCIDVEMKDVSNLEDKNPEYILSNVRCSFGFMDE